MKQKNFHHKVVKIIILYGIIAFIFFLLPQSTYAVTVSIDEPIPPISSESFTITVHITGAKAGTNYLKIDLYKDGTNNYFGETYNGIDWYNGSDGTKYLPIPIQTGIVSQGQINGKLGSPTTNEYDGVGQYKMRVRRYTESGYPGSSDVLSTVDITIITPTNTPTPTPTPPTETAQPTPTQTPTPTTIPVSHNNIFISEVMPYPEDNNEEWIELYNNNDFSVSLDNWYIDDGENTGSSPKLFAMAILPKQYMVIDVSLFNNDKDTVRLLDFNKTEKDSFSYTTTTKGKTYGRTSFSSHDFCQQNQTKGTSNSGCIESEPEKPPIPTPSQTPSLTPTQTITPSQSPQITTAFSLSQAQIIVDIEPNIGETISSDIQSLPSHGAVLSAETENDKAQKQRKAKAYVLGLSSSSALISLLNIGNIIRKIRHRLTR